MLLPRFRFSFHLSHCLSRYLLQTLHSGYFSRDLAVLAQINLWLCSFIRELTAIVLNLSSVCVCVCSDHSKCLSLVDTRFQSLKGRTKLSHVQVPITFYQLQQRLVVWEEQSITALSSGSSRQGFEVVIEWKQLFLYVINNF